MNLDSAVFYVSDLQKSIDFVEKFSCLKMDYRDGERFASFLFDNNARLSIKIAIEEREIPGAQTIFVESKDAKADYERLKEIDAPFSSELEEHEWGNIFSINDPDGNKIEFYERQ